MPACIFRSCDRPTAPWSRVCCAEHLAEVDAIEAERYGCYPVEPLAASPTADRCPHCGCRSTARSYPVADRVYRCQRPTCGEVFRVEEGAMPERVLIYGSRVWGDHAPIRALVDSLPADALVITGGASGADHIAHLAARHRGLATRVYPADWKKHGKAAGPMRNQQMIDEGKPTRAHGFRAPGKSSGTDDMTRRLVAAEIPHEVHHAAVARLTGGARG